MDVHNVHLLQRLNENGFLMLNEDPEYPSLCGMGGGWSELIGLASRGDAFLTTWVNSKRTLISRSVYQAFQCLECSDYEPTTCEQAILDFLGTNGQTDIRQLHTCLQFAKKELLKAMSSLQNRLLVAVTGEAKSLTKNWGVYSVDLSTNRSQIPERQLTNLEAQAIIHSTFQGVLTEAELFKRSGRQVVFPKYYQAYDARYKHVHAEKLLWFLDEPTPEVLAWLDATGVDAAELIGDVGCGEGRDALHLAAMGYKVVGMDVSEEGILICSSRSAERQLVIDWHVIDLASKTFKPKMKFQWLYSIATLHMLTEAADRGTFLANLYAMLKPGGSLLLVNKGDGVHEVRNRELDAFQLVERTHMGTGKKLLLPATSYYQATWDQLQSEVIEAGFTIAKMFLSENENYGQCMTMYLTR